MCGQDVKRAKQLTIVEKERLTKMKVTVEIQRKTASDYGRQLDNMVT